MQRRRGAPEQAHRERRPRAAAERERQRDTASHRPWGGATNGWRQDSRSWWRPRRACHPAKDPPMCASTADSTWRSLGDRTARRPEPRHSSGTAPVAARFLRFLGKPVSVELRRIGGICPTQRTGSVARKGRFRGCQATLRRARNGEYSKAERSGASRDERGMRGRRNHGSGAWHTLADLRLPSRATWLCR
jgi:hypothetical protein